MEQPPELVDVHQKLFPIHINYLKTIDDNLSNANRKALDTLIKQDKTQFIERYLLLFAFGLIFIVLAMFVAFFSIMVLLIAIGFFYMCYSLIVIGIRMVKK